jgi:nucleoside triphosphate diphosphatase
VSSDQIGTGQVQQLLEIMERLRDPEQGCPWDQEQDFSTIAPYTLEEAYEVADAIERNAPEDLCDELGDLLFQVVFHAQMARERGWFCFDDVVASINRKMIRRHPHVFADAQVENAHEQTKAWERHKAEERAAKSGSCGSALDGVPVAMPALVRAQKLQRRAARAGFDWTDISDVIDKLDEELQELRQALQEAEPLARVQEELGDLLFSGVNLARFLEADAESVLRAASRKFDQRFRMVEVKAQQEGKSLRDCSLDQLEAYWQQAKNQSG